MMCRSNRVSGLDFHWKQTDRHAKYIYINVSGNHTFEIFYYYLSEFSTKPGCLILFASLKTVLRSIEFVLLPLEQIHKGTGCQKSSLMQKPQFFISDVMLYFSRNFRMYFFLGWLKIISIVSVRRNPQVTFKKKNLFKNCPNFKEKHMDHLV